MGFGRDIDGIDSDVCSAGSLKLLKPHPFVLIGPSATFLFIYLYHVMILLMLLMFLKVRNVQW